MKFRSYVHFSPLKTFHFRSAPCTLFFVLDSTLASIFCKGHQANFSVTIERFVCLCTIVTHWSLREGQIHRWPFSAARQSKEEKKWQRFRSRSSFTAGLHFSHGSGFI
jgi:hypothetical protein